MNKQDLITRLIDATNVIEDEEQNTFDAGEIEDILVEAGIPIFMSNQPRRK